MRVPKDLSLAFGEEFETELTRFAADQGLLPPEALDELQKGEKPLRNARFLSRSILPHVLKLSAMFNRRVTEDAEALPGRSGRNGGRNREKFDQAKALDPYWKESSNPANLRLAYLLYFMPANLYRMAAAWSELGRLGFRWNARGSLRGIEFGAGPAAGACGIAAGERFSPVGIPGEGDWALIEQDKATLKLGSEWALRYFATQGFGGWGTRPFHRTVELSRGLLPRAAPKFNLWISSYFLNELDESPSKIASALLDAWDRHLDEEGVVVLVEPALKLQSRKLLEIRREILDAADRRATREIQLLLPCLGDQVCGALASPEDWCHEEVSWWRPPYFKAIDHMAELDRKTLPFSYLTFAKSTRAREQILPALQGAKRLHRLVSPAHAEGRDLEFFVCGEEGKQRARYRPESPEQEEINRGDILCDAELRGSQHAARVEKIRDVK